MTRLRVLLVAAATCAACSSATAVDRDGGPDAEPCATDQVFESFEDCHDGCDNDGDALTDCEDPDCEHYCCAVVGAEDLDCTDECDNDLDGLIDCYDPECEDHAACRTPAPPEDLCGEGADVCCSNGVDDDGDGAMDCADRDCGCCPLLLEHVDEANGELDEGFWVPLWLPGSGPSADEEGWIVDWGSEGRLSATSTVPVDLATRVDVAFTVRTDSTELCPTPWTCRHLLGVAFASSREGAHPGSAPPHLFALIVTSTHVSVVNDEDVLHQIGIEPLPGAEPRTHRVVLRLRPSLGGDGFGVEVRVEGGRETCQPDGSSLGCRDEEVFVLDEGALDGAANLLDDGSRGAFLMLSGEGTAVQLSDAAGQTVEVRDWGCPHPAVWSPGERGDVVDAEVVCWAVAELGSPSVVPLADGALGMALDGATRVNVGYGAHHASLAWVESTAVGGGPWRDPYLQRNIRRQPIDTDFDLNCMGDLEWVGAECREVPEHPEPPPEGCDEALGRSSPAVIASPAGGHHILYSAERSSSSRESMIVAARFGVESWSWLEVPHELRAEDLDDLADPPDRSYGSIRQPTALCRESSEEGGGCPDGEYLVVAVAQGQLWSEPMDSYVRDGDDVVVFLYSLDRGFEGPGAVLLRGDAGGPLEGLEVREPFLLYDGARERYLLWLTTERHGWEPELALYEGACPGCGDEPRHDLSAVAFERHGASPVLRAEDLEELLRDEEGLWVDCSGRCELGGVAGLVLPADGWEPEALHMWVEVTSMPAEGDLPRSAIHHIWQPLGWP